MIRELRAIVRIARLLLVLAVIYALYAGQEIIIPLILAMLFSFFLAPIVQGLEKLHVPRSVAAVLVTAFAFSFVALVGWAVLSEFIDMTTNGSRYAEPLTRKFVGLQSLINKQFQSFGLTFRLSGADIMSAGTLTLAPHFLVGAVILSIVAVLTCLMIVHREDIRDRILRLMGERNVLTSTALLDQAGARLSRYLGVALAVNLFYASLFCLILLLFGVPNPVVWASAVVVLRFLPHVGVIMCVLPPAALIFATNPGWHLPTIFVISAISLDLLFTNIIEPLTYGARTGISTLPLFVATLFWTWLWGIPGLALATPLTICLAILGRAVPTLRIFSIVFDIQSPLEPGQRLCQRLVVGDAKGAQSLWSDSTVTNRIETFVLPCLSFLKANRELDIADNGLEEKVMRGLKNLLHADIENHAPQDAAAKVLVICDRSAFGKLLALAACASLALEGKGTRLVPLRTVLSGSFNSAWLSNNQINSILLVHFGGSKSRLIRFISKRLKVARIRVPVTIYNPNSKTPRIDIEIEQPQKQYVYATSFSQVSDILTADVQPA